jgi:PKD repeat protein
MRGAVKSVCLAVLAMALAATAAEAQRKGNLQVGKNGEVVFSGTTFRNMAAFQRSQQFRHGGLRCGTQEPQDLESFWFEAASDCTMSSTTIRSEYNPGGGTVYTIKVVFHIVRKTDGTGEISDSLIQSQLAILNEDFRSLVGTPGDPGVDTGIQFVLATTDPSGNPTTGIVRHTNNTWFADPGPGAFNAMKQAINWDPTRYLNVYTNDAAGNLGYATFPQESAGDYEDGVVLLWSSVGRNAPSGGIYNQGRTGTHEIGHWLGLFHTFQGGCGTASAPYTTGDLIADTNRQQSANFDCPVGATSCSVTSPIRNYMNYTQDTCMWEFTAEQANRMRCSLTSYRSSLYGGGGGGGGGSTALQNGVPVTGISGAAGSEQRWTFAVPSGSSNLNIAISGGTGDADLYVRFGSAPTTTTYDCRPYKSGNAESCPVPSPSTGTYHVMIRAYSAYSGVTLTGSYTTGGTNAAPTANFTFTTSGLTASFTDTSTDSDGTIASRSWSFGDGGTSTATNPSRTYAAAGTYTVSLTVTDNGGRTGTTSKSVTVTAPPASCSGGTLYSGTLSSGGQAYQPNNSYYQSTVSGTHSGTLDGPTGTDFDLYLQKWNGSTWTNVRSGTTSSPDESISYSGTAGYYRYRVHAYSGSGSYTLCVTRP